jgi:hypothetical protein
MPDLRTGCPAFIAVLSAIAIDVCAQTFPQTWVSGLGNDANPCSFAQPCQSLNAALARTTPKGEITILDPGPYSGGFLINKSVTINAAGAIGTIVSSSGQPGLSINVTSSDAVIFRGLSFDGAGNAQNGVVFFGGGALHLENCTLFGFTGDALLFQPSTAACFYVQNSSFRSNSGGGVYIRPSANGSATASFNRTRFDQNSTRGLRADDGSVVIVRDSAAANNLAQGFVAYSSGFRPTIMTLDNVSSSFNVVNGVGALGSLATVRITNVTLNDNGYYGVSISGGAVVYSYGTNRIAGNGQGSLISGTALTPAALQ